MGLPELDDVYHKALECDRVARLYFGMLRSAMESASPTRLERAREYGDYVLGLSIKTRRAVKRARQQLLLAHDPKREYRSCRTPHPTSAHLSVHRLAHDAVVAWSEHLAHILRCSWYATERDPATFSDGMRELQVDLAALGEPTWTPADLEVEWTAARRLNYNPAPGPAAEAAEPRGNDPNRPSDERRQEILAAINNAGTPLMRKEIMVALKYPREGKLGAHLAWMVKAGILINIPQRGYWPAAAPPPDPGV